jgi:hypothetical protein
MTEQYVVTADRIRAVLGFIEGERKAADDMAKIDLSRKELRAKTFADWKAQGIEPKHFRKAKEGDNLHKTINGFLHNLSAYATPIGKGKNIQYMTPELVAEYNDESLGNAHLILGRPKAQTKGAPVTNWRSQIGTVMSGLKDGYATYLADLEAPADKTTVNKTVSTPEELWMKTLQTMYGKTQKAEFKMPDADMILKGLHMIALGVTGKDGQIKTGDKTKK